MTRRRRRLLAVLALAAVLAAAFDIRLRTVVYEVPCRDLAAPVRLAVLTDLHSCAYGPEQRTLLDAVAECAPDAVLLGGDIVDDVLPEAHAWTTVRALAAAYPCAYVTGNHEWWSGQAERICGEMAALGVCVLRGGSVTWQLNGQEVTVFGIDDPDSGEDQLPEILDAVRKEAATVLLAHRPERIESYRQAPFDLIVSGHAHGGQWRLPGLVNGLFAPHQGFFPRYAGGRYDWDGTTFLVSRGLSRENSRVPRIFNRPELLVIQLTPAA